MAEQTPLQTRKAPAAHTPPPPVPHPQGAFLSPAETARRLGVSAKALRLYESRGLVAPLRAAIASVRKQKAAETAAPRVAFYTMVRGEG